MMYFFQSFSPLWWGASHPLEHLEKHIRPVYSAIDTARSVPDANSFVASARSEL